VIRQRIAVRTPLAAYLVRLLTLLLGAALVWYGLMVVLLAAKVAPHTVNNLSAYRTLYNDAASLTRHDFTTAVRLIAGFAGLLVFLIFLAVALGTVPRPYLARGTIDLQADGGRGHTEIAPRAVERVAESAAQGNPNVRSARGRLGDRELHVDIASGAPEAVADTLTDVQTRALSSTATTSPRSTCTSP
jgi:Cu/Ag efflux pump CusA